MGADLGRMLTVPTRSISAPAAHAPRATTLWPRCRPARWTRGVSCAPRERASSDTRA